MLEYSVMSRSGLHKSSFLCLHCELHMCELIQSEGKKLVARNVLNYFMLFRYGTGFCELFLRSWRAHMIVYIQVYEVSEHAEAGRGSTCRLFEK